MESRTPLSSVQPSANTKLMTFGKKPTQLAIQKTSKIRINPKNPIESFPLIFEINSSEGMLDWDRTQLFLRFQLCNTDGTVIDETKAGKVTTVNYLGNTFINRLKFYASNNLVYDSLDTYAYKAYLESVLFEPEEVKKTLLVSALYSEDAAGKEPNTDANEGFKHRYSVTKKGTFTTISPLHADIFTAQQYFPRMVDYRLEMFRNSDAFLLLASKTSNESYALTLTKAELLVHVVYPLPSFTLAYERTMSKIPAQFNIKKVRHTFKHSGSLLSQVASPVRGLVVSTPVRTPLYDSSAFQTEIKVLHLAAGRSDLPNACIHTGVLPRRVILMMVPSADYFGSKTTNPFRFKSFDLQRYQLRANDKLFPNVPQDMDFAGSEAFEMYRQLFDSLAGSSHMCTVTYDQFLDGYTFIVTDLSPDSSGSAGATLCQQPVLLASLLLAHTQPLEQGTLSVDMKFKKDVPANTHGLKLLFYLEWDDFFS